MKNYTIYAITDAVTEEILYVGKTKNLKSRMVEHGLRLFGCTKGVFKEKAAHCKVLMKVDGIFVDEAEQLWLMLLHPPENLNYVFLCPEEVPAAIERLQILGANLQPYYQKREKLKKELGLC